MCVYLCQNHKNPCPKSSSEREEPVLLTVWCPSAHGEGGWVLEGDLSPIWGCFGRLWLYLLQFQFGCEQTVGMSLSCVLGRNCSLAQLWLPLNPGSAQGQAGCSPSSKFHSLLFFFPFPSVNNTKKCTCTSFVFEHPIYLIFSNICNCRKFSQP